MLKPDAGAGARLPPLVMRFGAFGDMVLLTVLLRQLHVRFGRPVDVISSGPWTLPLLQGQPSVGRVHVIRSRRTPYWLSLDQQRLVGWLRGRGAGPTWFCDIHRGRDLLLRGGIPEDYICDSREHPWVAGETFGARYLRLANQTAPAFRGLPADVWPASAPAGSSAAKLYLTDPQRAAAHAWLTARGLEGRPFVVVHPGSRHIARRGLRSRAGAEKYWPEQRWAQVIRALRDLQQDCAILLTGTRGERQLNADIIAAAASHEVYNAAGELNIDMLLPLLERARGMISVDTGPAHAAAALGCPVVSLLGPASPTLFRPGSALTGVAALTGEVAGVQAMLGISVSQVMQAWLQLMGERSARENPATPP